eukprot:1343560-Amorphochlora_amoeboformis.AAC.1
MARLSRPFSSPVCTGPFPLPISPSALTSSPFPMYVRACFYYLDTNVCIKWDSAGKVGLSG